ncbi:uncharacterized protein LTR77_010737 [Saxophila tyrrhenica]|uniref:SMP-LTD domain-containing protein n=1 Tax=Saxophila tyrrhenica TaxID=1690608 RepID=A0AAV9NX36_9PEZI|nr:hypothetical protein LTR77_010737 [Saxophila tyrrhenica]
MTFKGLLYVYLLGGLTFIPLVLAAVLIPAWLLLPKVEDESGQKQKGVKNGSKAEGRDKKNEDDTHAVSSTEAAAEATFAVLRTYDFPAANAALNARHSSGNTAGGVTGTTDGEADGNEGGGSSVYQSVYRSVFAPSKSNTAGGNTNREVLENDETTVTPDGRAKRKTTPANVFYIVLRHGHLMLYDSASQMEVRHVISLAHHTVSLSEGLSAGDEASLKDADLFIKRTAIVLTPTDMPNGGLQSRAAPPKPFYLFSTLCSEKEDFYHALLYTRAHPPVPEPLEPNDIIKLQSTLHSTSQTPETMAFNALIGRIFLSIYHTPWLKDLIQRKIEKKISRVQKPAFLADLTVKSIDLGNAAPVLSKPRLKDLNISGDMTVAFDVKYTGALQLTISALAKLDLGPRFKTRTVDLVLASSLQRLQGHILVRIKPPPSNRIWFCFESPPDMDVKVEPVVSQRKISYTFILRTIEDRIRAVVTETLVKPNWDDMPFFNTADQYVRGGIWRDEGVTQDSEPTAKDMLRERNAKTKSMPVLPLGAEHDSSAGSSGSETTAKAATGASTVPSDVAAELKRRSVVSLPTRSGTNISTTSAPPSRDGPNGSPGLPPTRPLRSPSFTSPSTSQPSVALDESLANMDPGKLDRSQNQSRRWRIRSAAPPLPARKDAAGGLRDMRDRVLAHREAAEAEATQADILEGEASLVEEPADGHSTGDEQVDQTEGRRSSDSPAPSLGSTKRTDTNASTSSSATSRSTQQRKQNLLAATAAATNAARNWSWNALANARKQGSPTAPRAASTTTGQSPQPQPMGRGQPLPPPGVPLPGPQKGLFAGLGTVRRKPVAARTNSSLPASREGASSRDGEKSDVEASGAEEPRTNGEDQRSVMSDEFGPWRENSGLDEDGSRIKEGSVLATRPETSGSQRSGMAEVETPDEEVREKPPLPPRRDTRPPAAETASAEPADLNTTSQESPAETASSASRTAYFADPAASSESLQNASAVPQPQAYDQQAADKAILDEPGLQEDRDGDLQPEPAGHQPMAGMSQDNASEEQIVAIPAPMEPGDEFEARAAPGRGEESSDNALDQTAGREDEQGKPPLPSR